MLAHRRFGLTVHPRLTEHRSQRNWSWTTFALMAGCAVGLLAIA